MPDPEAGGGRGPAGRSGFDHRPARSGYSTAVLLFVVVVAAGVFAHLFKWSLRWGVHTYSSAFESTDASAELATVTLFLVATSGVLTAAAIGHVVRREWAGRVGIEAVAASAREEGRSISLRATSLRAAGTWIVTAGLASIGRESAIVEAGGALGSVAGRHSGGRGDALAAAGIASGFAAAYHAPVAAIFYVEEHLRVRQSTRATLFVVVGAVTGHLVTIVVFDGAAIFPGIDFAWPGSAVDVLIVLVPTVVVARLFLEMRVHVDSDALVRRFGCRRWVAVGIFGVVAGVSVAAFPLAAGNGMDALQRAPENATVTLALALLLGKMIGTTASLGSGAPGGVLTPSMGVAAGCALAVLLAGESMGLGADRPWDVMAAAMAVGVAVGMRSPLVAIFLIPEMLGAYHLVPFIALVVGVAVILDRGLDRVLVSAGRSVPTDVYDADA